MYNLAKLDHQIMSKFYLMSIHLTKAHTSEMLFTQNFDQYIDSPCNLYLYCTMYSMTLSNPYRAHELLLSNYHYQSTN